MSGSFGPGDPGYTIISPRQNENVAVIEAVATALCQLFEAGVVTAREEAKRHIIEIQTRARIDEFRVNMTLLEKQLDNHNLTELDRQQSWFQIANKLIEMGNEQAAITVLELFSKEGRQSLIEPLIEYHERVSLGILKSEPSKKD